MKFGAAPLPQNSGQSGKDSEEESHRQGREDRAAFAPEPGFLRKGDWPRQNRPVLEESTEVIRQHLCGWITPGRVLLQTFETDRLQIDRHARIQPARSDRLGVLDLEQNLRQSLALKRRPACKQVIEDCTE